MNRRLTARIERWAVQGAFTIARGAKTEVDVVVAEVAADGCFGRGEGTAIYYRGETAAGVLAAVEGQADAIAGGIGRDDLNRRMPPGAARNALDCALWDLEARLAGQPVWALAGLPAPVPLATARTVSLGLPAAMEEQARALAEAPLLKLKLAGDGDRQRVAAVRRGAPEARLIVDANEAWAPDAVAANAAALAELGVELIEQPVRAGEDAALAGLDAPVPFCADESCQSRADLPALVGRYRAINIKLDKCGGLTEALALAAAARAEGLEVMLGCMLATSLGIAPAFLLGAAARWVDLDGALLLATDRAEGMVAADGWLQPPTPALWG